MGVVPPSKNSASLRFYIRDKIVQSARRAGLCARAAADALFIVDRREVTLNMHCVVLAGFDALHAADAARAASLAGHGALVMVRAEHRRLRALRNDRDHLLRAGLGAKAAADADGRVDSRNAVVPGNRVMRTDLCAVSEAEAAIRARALAAEEQLCRLTRGNAR